MTSSSDDFDKDHFDKIMILVGLIEQLNTMITVFYLEKEKIKKQIEEAESNTISKSEGFSFSFSTPWINTTHESALKTSIIFFQFSVIEAIVNFLSDLTIQITESTYIIPKTNLEQPELDFLSEQTTFFDPNKKEMKVKKSFKRLEDKIGTIPFLFAKLMGSEFSLNKNEGHWSKFKDIKIKRDSLTHPKTKRNYVSDKDIFEASGIIYWLCENYFFLIRDCIYPENNEFYKYIEISTGKLIGYSNFATMKEFSIKPYMEKQTRFRKKLI